MSAVIWSQDGNTLYAGIVFQDVGCKNIPVKYPVHKINVGLCYDDISVTTISVASYRESSVKLFTILHSVVLSKPFHTNPSLLVWNMHKTHWC